MNKHIKNFSFNLLRHLNIHLTRPVDEKQILLLLKKLRPVTTDKNLVRLGPRGDGGYLVPNDLGGIKACFSPGVDCVSGFESDCANMGMDVYLADKSVEEPAEAHERFHFTKKYLGVTTNNDFMTLDKWVDESISSSHEDLLLQIDIEGFEYEVFLAASDQLLQRFRIIVVEFHNLHELWNKPFFEIASRVFDKLLQTHTCVHNHPNNDHESVKYKNIELPYLTELTFLRNDRVVNPQYSKTFPHPLDSDNTGNVALPLPKCWYT